MPPKRGTKRKAAGSSATKSNGEAPLTPPDRKTWPGWVEMESEPSFFNVMLREMGVEGVKVQEIYDLDENMLAFLPEPVHAFIFLFRYRDPDTAVQESGDCPNHVWFANQTPDYACATFALLNIVNNIPGLHLGNELKDFKEFTATMDPLSRGDAVDSFTFVKQIHNSFARETDLLQADMNLWSKADKYKKRLAAVKARQTREAKKAAATSLATNEVRSRQANGIEPDRRSGRAIKSTRKKSVASEDESLKHEDSDYRGSPKPNGVHDKEETGESGVRRSKRTPKPRKDPFVTAAAAAVEEDEEAGFHFIAYMPIRDHVWKLDGLDRYPQDLGSFTPHDGGDWKHVAVPELMARMAQFDEGIQYNLMAVTHDPALADQGALASNIKALRVIEGRLDKLAEGWKEMEGAETPKDLLLDTALEFGVSAADVDGAGLAAHVQERLCEEDDLLKLLQLRKVVIGQQSVLRASVRDAIVATKADDEKARHRRHDYTAFVRGWLGALAQEEVLADLVAAAQ